MPELKRNAMRRLIWLAKSKGAVKVRDWKWDIAGSCHVPKEVLFQSEETPFRRKGEFRLLMKVPCRKCEACWKIKQTDWVSRSMAECAVAQRTWFGTLTLTLEQHHRATMMADALRKQRGWDNNPEALNSARFIVIGKEVTKFLKRVRKNSGAKLKYLAVMELHGSGKYRRRDGVIAERQLSGLPHFHLLIHEQNGSVPIRWKVLNDAWKFGHSKFKLAEDRETLKSTAFYVCKYMSKDASAHVRASLYYGKLKSVLRGLGSS